jgi:hypothetical protein
MNPVSPCSNSSRGEAVSNLGKQVQDGVASKLHYQRALLEELGKSIQALVETAAQGLIDHPALAPSTSEAKDVPIRQCPLSNQIDESNNIIRNQIEIIQDFKRKLNL